MWEFNEDSVEKGNIMHIFVVSKELPKGGPSSLKNTAANLRARAARMCVEWSVKRKRSSQIDEEENLRSKKEAKHACLHQRFYAGNVSLC